MEERKKGKVFVGMSGGVDSSVVTALLVKEGYDVTGAFIKAWHPDFLTCNWREDRRDAMRVCARLNIPFITINLENEYKREVVDYMISEYKKGRTPNPDVMCNKEIKFGHFYKKAKKLGADFIATGHYAQNIDGRITKSKDTNKDQTYFLWAIKPQALKNVLFPIGHLKKSEVRKIAKKMNLPVFDKKDSQGVCFLGQVDMKEFLTHELKPRPGNVLSVSGEVIGEHPGAILFTIGERRGFKITKKTSDSEAVFVVSKDIKKNTITVSNNTTEDEVRTLVENVMLQDVNWVSREPENNKTYDAMFRYRQKPTKVRFIKVGKTARLDLLEPRGDITPGQSAVLYNKNVCLGGGIIV